MQTNAHHGQKRVSIECKSPSNHETGQLLLDIDWHTPLSNIENWGTNKMFNDIGEQYASDCFHQLPAPPLSCTQALPPRSPSPSYLVANPSYNSLGFEGGLNESTSRDKPVLDANKYNAEAQSIKNQMKKHQHLTQEEEGTANAIEYNNHKLRKPNSLLNGLENDVDFSNQLHHSNLANVRAAQDVQADAETDPRLMVNNSTADRHLPNFHDAAVKLSDYQMNPSEFSKQAHYFDISNTERMTTENRASNNFSKNAHSINHTEDAIKMQKGQIKENVRSSTNKKYNKNEHQKEEDASQGKVFHASMSKNENHSNHRVKHANINQSFHKTAKTKQPGKHSQAKDISETTKFPSLVPHQVMASNERVDQRGLAPAPLNGHYSSSLGTQISHMHTSSLEMTPANNASQQRSPNNNRIPTILNESALQDYKMDSLKHKIQRLDLEKKIMTVYKKSAPQNLISSSDSKGKGPLVEDLTLTELDPVNQAGHQAAILSELSTYQQKQHGIIMAQQTPNSYSKIKENNSGIPAAVNEINSGQLEILNGNVILNARHGNDMILQPINQQLKTQKKQMRRKHQRRDPRDPFMVQYNSTRPQRNDGGMMQEQLNYKGMKHGQQRNLTTRYKGAAQNAPFELPTPYHESGRIAAIMMSRGGGPGDASGNHARKHTKNQQRFQIQKQHDDIANKGGLPTPTGQQVLVAS